jgi:hypothetical protein
MLLLLLLPSAGVEVDAVSVPVPVPVTEAEADAEGKTLLSGLPASSSKDRTEDATATTIVVAAVY